MKRFVSLLLLALLYLVSMLSFSSAHAQGNSKPSAEDLRKFQCLLVAISAFDSDVSVLYGGNSAPGRVARCEFCSLLETFPELWNTSPGSVEELVQHIIWIYHLEETHQLLSMIDTNHDGVLTPEELEQYIESRAERLILGLRTMLRGQARLLERLIAEYVRREFTRRLPEATPDQLNQIVNGIVTFNGQLDATELAYLELALGERLDKAREGCDRYDFACVRNKFLEGLLGDGYIDRGGYDLMKRFNLLSWLFDLMRDYFMDRRVARTLALMRLAHLRCADVLSVDELMEVLGCRYCAGTDLPMENDEESGQGTDTGATCGGEGSGIPQ